VIGRRDGGSVWRRGGVYGGLVPFGGGAEFTVAWFRSAAGRSLRWFGFVRRRNGVYGGLVPFGGGLALRKNVVNPSLETPPRHP